MLRWTGIANGCSDEVAKYDWRNVTKRVARLDRVRSDLMGTFGRLTTPLGFYALSIELPWFDNERNVSCIPPGQYAAEWTYSPRFKRDMYILIGVPDRDGIRIHVGNLAGSVRDGFRSHFNGCIGLGTRLGILAGQRAVLLSAPTIMGFEDHMERQPFTLEVA